MIVLKKSKTDNSVLFVDASAQFKRVGNKNKLMGEDQEKILGALDAREFQEYFAALVSNEEIGKNDYNLAVSSYVEPEDTREVIDIVELNAEIARIANLARTQACDMLIAAGGGKAIDAVKAAADEGFGADLEG